MIKKKIKKILLNPPYVKHCSQTIYEVLLGCVTMFEKTEKKDWEVRANHLKDILINIQCKDGGFDIGYDFNFGKLHKKGESTSPELVALISLAEFTRVFGLQKEVFEAMQKSAEWIRKNSIDLGNSKFAIPYGPYSTKEIMVYNGTSFACAALGCFIGVTKSEDEVLLKIYKGMNKYLFEVLSSTDELSGKFWYYNDQSRDDLTEVIRNKIDYYHQMQQVEVHSIAQNYCPNSYQEQIIKLASRHVLCLQDKKGFVPYANNKIYFNDLVHVWGFSSVISGFIETYKHFSEKEYLEGAKKVYNWLLEYSWNGEYFYPVLYQDGKVKNDWYMVRSDAWVFSSLSKYYLFFSEEKTEKIINNLYEKMHSVNFSGPESHAQDLKKKVIVKLIKLFSFGKNFISK